MKYINRKTILSVLAIAFIIMQFFRIDKTNPPVNQSLDFITITQPTPEIALQCSLAV